MKNFQTDDAVWAEREGKEENNGRKQGGSKLEDERRINGFSAGERSSKIRLKNNCCVPTLINPDWILLVLLCC